MAFENVMRFIRGGQKSPDQNRLDRMQARIEHMEEKEATAAVQKQEAAQKDAAEIAANIQRVEKVTKDINQISDGMRPREDIREAA